MASRAAAHEWRLAHLSDLHLGSGAEAEDGVRALLRAVDAGQIDHVVVTGDVTHGGRRSEVERFFGLFGPLLLGGRATVVPGNHDRMNDDVGPALMPGERVQALRLPGLYLVLVDSTAPHNRSWHLGHGEISPRDLSALERALEEAPDGLPCAVALHHHPLPLPGDDVADVLFALLGLPWTVELAMGAALLEVLRDRCDLLLHGHRHAPSEQTLFSAGRRPLRVFNAGRSPSLRRFRVFGCRGGFLAAQPEWMAAIAEGPPPFRKAG